MTINVSAPLFAHPVPTKTKPGSPRANHAQAIPTALPVPPVAHILQLHAQRIQIPFHQHHVLPRVVLLMDPQATTNHVLIVVLQIAPIQQDFIARQVQICALIVKQNAARLLKHLIMKNVKLSPTDASVPNVSLVTIQPIVYNVSFFDLL